MSTSFARAGAVCGGVLGVPGTGPEPSEATEIEPTPAPASDDSPPSWATSVPGTGTVFVAPRPGASRDVWPAMTPAPAVTSVATAMDAATTFSLPRNMAWHTPF